MTRAPAFFMPHGGGPMPLMDDALHVDMVKFLTTKARKLLALETAPPKAIVLITAHWETSVPTISSGPNPELYYDYYGFPPETYKLKYPAPGSPEVAEKVKQALLAGGFPQVKLDSKRGWDHGVFVPMTLLWPQADIPIVQMSVLTSQNAAEHIALGRALTALRDENIMIIGSGMSFHNMGALRASFGKTGKVETKNAPFDEALTKACESDGKERGELLEDWEKGFPDAYYSHPKGAAEHFMPLIVAAGAGGEEKGEKVLDWIGFGQKISAYLWK